MTWFKVDDTLAIHPKAVTAGNRALGLWVRAGAWSSAHLTDGHIPRSIITVLGGNQADATRLVNAGLWHPTNEGWQFHEWDQRQPASTDIVAQRQANAARKARSRQTRHLRGVE